MTVGENIKRARKEAHLTQKQLGEKLGVKQATIAMYERDATNIKYTTVERLANALDVQPYVLMLSDEDRRQRIANMIECILIVKRNRGYTNKDIASITGVDLETVTNILSTDNPDQLSFPVVELINDILDFSEMQDSMKLTDGEMRLLGEYSRLNVIGQEEAIKRIRELTEISKYKYNNDPD